MIFSALVVTLPIDRAIRSRLLARLADDPRITLGEPARHRLPIVAETIDARDGASLVEGLLELPGVHVDVVAIDFSDDEVA